MLLHAVERSTYHSQRKGQFSGTRLAKAKDFDLRKTVVGANLRNGISDC
jgi:hypothetical protein